MRTQTNAQEPKLFIGLDIHKRSWKAHFRTDLFAGKAHSMPPEPLAIRKFINKHYSDHQIYIAYEAGGCGFSAYRDFQKFNWECIVVNPADIPKPAKQTVVKTDAVDCANLSRQLKAGQLRGIYVPSIQREQLRCLFRQRSHLVRQMRSIKSRIKAHLCYFGIKLPDKFDNANWSKAMIAWIEKIPWDYETAAVCTGSILNEYDFTDGQVKYVSNEIRKYCRIHYKKDYYLLMTVPGIGPITAAALLAEIGDLSRFSNFRKLASYVGLIPGVHQSGQSLQITGMTPRANSILRSMLVEAAWVAARTDPVIQAYYRKHFGKESKKIIVKVAHKLLSRTHAVIKSQRPYEIGLVA